MNMLREVRERCMGVLQVTGQKNSPDKIWGVYTERRKPLVIYTTMAPNLTSFAMSGGAFVA